jgi:DoxX-like protein
VKADLLRTPRTYDALGAFMAASAAADAKPASFVTDTLDSVNFPRQYRWIFAPIKGAAAVGLLSARWFPGLARLTAAMATLYFVLAVAFHAKARHIDSSAVSAAVFAVTFGVVAARGPDVSR